MESIFYHYDLVTPDGMISKLTPLGEDLARAEVRIEKISPYFLGYEVKELQFNIKSTLAQLGLNGYLVDYHLEHGSCNLSVELKAIGSYAKKLLALLQTGAFIGKLFVKDERRRVRDPYYLLRMIGRQDRFGRPLLSLANGGRSLSLEKIDGRTVAFLKPLEGAVIYDKDIEGFLPTLAKSLCNPQMKLRELLHLNQVRDEKAPQKVCEGKLLLVRTKPLHIRTVFAKVVDELLPKGFRHLSANLLQPDTEASGDIYEFCGNSDQELETIPLEFYTLEPYREHVFFADRDQLQAALEDPKALFKAFATAPSSVLAALFVVKGGQLLSLKAEDWAIREQKKVPFPGIFQGDEQHLMAESYAEAQPAYPFLKAIMDGQITSQGVLLCRYFPSPLLKSFLLNEQVFSCLKGIYFQMPSLTYGYFFSQEDQGMLNDLAKFGVPTYWVDELTQKILQYVQKPTWDFGMFVPLDKTQTFLHATLFGIYGSNLIEGGFESELVQLFTGLIQLKQEMQHPLFHRETPIALVTGGGPGAMEVGNKVAMQLGILSCAHIVDFTPRFGNEVVREQQQNPFVEVKMTYRLEKLVERQAEFNLDFPILLMGGWGTDFEQALEEVRRKLGTSVASPILLFGSKEYWGKKITSRFRCNLESGTIKGSEWVSNCFYCVQTAEQALQVYTDYFSGNLAIGKGGPIYTDGFVAL